MVILRSFDNRRDLRKRNFFVGTKIRPEGSIAEAHVVQECVAFYARYL